MQLQRPFLAVTPSVDGDVLQVLASGHAEFTIPELHRLIPERSSNGIRLSIERLVDQGVVTVRLTGRTRSYRLNDDHLLSPAIRSIARAKTDFVERLRALLAPLDVPFAALFGSAAAGTMRADSDIDILLIYRDGEPPSDDRLVSLTREISALTGNDPRIVDLAASDVAGTRYSRLLDDIAASSIPLVGDTRSLSRFRAREATAVDR